MQNDSSPDSGRKADAAAHGAPAGQLMMRLMKSRLNPLFTLAATVMAPLAAQAQTMPASAARAAAPHDADDVEAGSSAAAPRAIDVTPPSSRVYPTAPAFADTRLDIAAPAWARDPRFAELVMDANTGEIVYERNGLAARHIASMTKVMTAYLVFEALENGALRRDQVLTASAHAASQTGMRYGLRPGQQITVDEAIHAMISMSANDIAVLLAEAVGGSERDFAETMTTTAHRIGAVNTTFGTASGLMLDNSSAYDIALIFRRLRNDFPGMYNEYFTPLTTEVRNETWNNCRLCDDGINATGQKTGTTSQAGHAIMVQLEQGDRRYIVVAIGTPNNQQRVGRAMTLARAVWTDLPATATVVMAAKAQPRP